MSKKHSTNQDAGQYTSWDANLRQKTVTIEILRKLLLFN